MRTDWNEYFMGLAHAASTRATCLRRHVGCVVVDKNNHVISTGYNGSEPGEPHCDEVGCLMINGSCKRTIHAETNAIKRSTWWKRRGGKLYCTDMPCYDCALRIAGSGIAEVYYDRDYVKTRDSVLRLFTDCGIVCDHIGE